MPPPLPLDVFASLPAYVRVIEAIVAQIPKLESRVAELESQPKLDSTNSSKPPSSDGLHVKPAPPRCDRCCTKLSGDDPDPIIDLPEKMRHVVHHRRHTLCCPECQARTMAAPVPDAASGFGPKLTAVTAYCSHRPIERLLHSWTLIGLDLSENTVNTNACRNFFRLDPMQIHPLHK